MIISLMCLVLIVGALTFQPALYSFSVLDHTITHKIKYRKFIKLRSICGTQKSCVCWLGVVVVIIIIETVGRSIVDAGVWRL